MSVRLCRTLVCFLPPLFWQMSCKLGPQTCSGQWAPEVIGKEASETVKFARMMNKFFDWTIFVLERGRGKCFRTHHDFDVNIVLLCAKDKCRLVHVQSCISHHPPLQWLEQEFLPYLSSWESSVSRQEEFTPKEKGKMMLSSAVYWHNHYNTLQLMYNYYYWYTHIWLRCEYWMVA